MSLFKRRDKSEERRSAVGQYLEMISAAGSLTTKSLLTGGKPKPRPYLPPTKPLTVIPESEEVAAHKRAQTGQVTHREEDYVPAVNELVRAATRASVASEAIIVSERAAELPARVESAAAATSPSLDIALIRQDLYDIYGEQDNAAPIIPAE